MTETGFGNWLRIKRIEAGYESQGLLSKACGIDNSTIARWEREDTRPTPDNLRKLAPILKVSYEQLMAAAGYITASTAAQKVVPQEPTSLEEQIRAHLQKDPDLTEEDHKIIIEDIMDYLEYRKAKQRAQKGGH